MGAEGEGGGDDHQHRGAGQEEVLPVLAGDRVGGVWTDVGVGGGGECSGADRFLALLKSNDEISFRVVPRIFAF